jgi:lipopolysaccharide/colanic/teichoic acid biosynthesis glycosyltransferase
MSHTANGGGAGPARPSRSSLLSRDALRPVLKRALDTAGAALLLALVAPTFTAVFLLLRLAGGGPPFLVRPRVGRGGRGFGLLTFRLPPAGGGLGRALRRTGIEEVPQLLNVLRGDMSLVGPRPAGRGELERSYALFGGAAAAAAYLSVRPGLVGPCQVRGGGGGLGARERVALDVAYAQAPSLRADLAILARALGLVLRGPVAG